MTICAFIGYLLDAANISDIERSDKLHTTECERSYSKRKSLYLFQLDYIQLQLALSSVTPWMYTVQTVPSKKKKREALKKERGKENEMGKGEEKERGGKEEKKKKGMERVCA